MSTNANINGSNNAMPPTHTGEIGNAPPPPSYPMTTAPQYEKHGVIPPGPQTQAQTHINGEGQPQQQKQQDYHPPRNVYQHATPLASLQSVPAPVDCPVCGVREMTRAEFRSGGTTHLSAILMCACLCLGCIPYLASWFKDCEHSCGNCGRLLAVWHRSGRTEVLWQK